MEMTSSLVYKFQFVGVTHEQTNYNLIHADVGGRQDQRSTDELDVDRRQIFSFKHGAL